MRDILLSIPHASRSTGSKQLLVQQLWDIHLSEQTLLSKLCNDSLDDLLKRFELKLGGSKATKIARLMDHAKSVDLSKLEERSTNDVEQDGIVPPPVG